MLATDSLIEVSVIANSYAQRTVKLGLTSLH